MRFRQAAMAGASSCCGAYRSRLLSRAPERARRLRNRRLQFFDVVEFNVAAIDQMLMRTLAMVLGERFVHRRLAMSDGCCRRRRQQPRRSACRKQTAHCKPDETRHRPSSSPALPRPWSKRVAPAPSYFPALFLSLSRAPMRPSHRCSPASVVPERPAPRDAAPGPVAALAALA